MELPGFRLSKKTTLPPLRFHNTLSGKIEVFTPLSEKEIKIYNCGPTAYDRQHIGNLFPPIVANLIQRTLLVWGYSVQEVNNITDFGHISEDEDTEDKMTKGLRREGMTLTLPHMRALAERYAALFFEDLPLLGVDPGKVTYPRASDYIPEQIAVIKTLEQKGYAYRTSDGVYFDTSKFTNYGELGGIRLSGLKEGARIEHNPQKHTPHDFALWKLDTKLGWESPWGLGFPGWHTECVAMIFKILGKQIDIHMGGVDLIPIHHNNEIAQAEAITGKQFVKYWIHNAHITVEGKKVSKSLGNTIYVSDLVDRGLSPSALRYWFLTAHYRTPTNFTWDAIEGANTALSRLRIFFESLATVSHEEPDQKFMNDFYGAFANDLDTPKTIALVWELIKNPDVSAQSKRASLLKADEILGLGLSEPLKSASSSIEVPEAVQALVKEREKARKMKHFAEADKLRSHIEELGYDITDTSEGPRLSPR